VDEQPLSTTCKSCKQLNASEPEWGSQITMNINQSWLLVLQCVTRRDQFSLKTKLI